MATAGDGRTKELRLAVVCYGGSSLAVYMHGVTKELNRLVKGSVLPAGTGTASEQTYSRLLDALTERDEGVRTRVVVDVIAGTSAGGINGICLAKGLAHNRSQDELRDLWFEHGDIEGLLDAPKILPRKAKFAWVAAKGLWSQPLKGDVMAKWIYDAFRKMDGQDPEPRDVTSLLPDRHLLELFVTVTDFYGYGRQVPYADPNPIQDTRHRHLLTFRYGGDGGQDDFGPTSNGALTFAARTTSCIPGVFPPVSLGKLKDWLGSSRAVDLDDLKRRFFRLYDLAGFDAAATWFVDGGVLDNKPFGPAIEAIRERPAGVEVDRRLLYLEPDPGAGPKPPDKPYSAPGTLAGAVGGLTGLPRAEPILDDLVEVGALNERVRRIKDIIVTSWGDVEQRVLALIGPIPTLPDDPASPELAHLRVLLDEEARKAADFSYATYVRMKISGVVDRYAQTACAVCDLPPDSTHALLARSVVRAWAGQRGLFEKSIEPTPTQLDFLISFDLDYGERRLRFVIDGLNHLYGRDDAPPRVQIDAAKARVWKAVHDLRDAMSGTQFDEELSGRYTTCFPVDVMREFMQQTGFDAGSYLDEDGHAEQLDQLEVALATFLDARLKGLTGKLYIDLLELTGTGDWTDKQRRDLLVRYLGFPFWDILLYPIQALSDVGERDEVPIVRMSPRDTHRIPNPNAPGKKLVGAGEHHFGAFLSDRGGREKDYLWGRLDGAERLVGLLVQDEADRARWCKEAFRAILDEDEQAVPNARDLVQHVRNSIGG